jgi:YidC/Oxa1 family membrane protein insertase
VLIVLYVGTQLAASAVTAISADPMQRRIMFALPFVFVIFIVNFEAGLIVYWITTNVWTIGQQLLVKKLYPKPDLAAAKAGADGGGGGKPARGKPPATAAAGTDNGSGDEAPKATAKAGGDKGAAAKSGSAKPASGKTPPRSPRKKKKRSGRRR